MDNFTQLWKEMISRSFHPRQWYVQDDDRFDGAYPSQEETFMWVYRKTESELYTVGYYDPQGKWMPESDYSNSKEAAERVAYLNGGRGTVNSGEVYEAAKRVVAELLCARFD